MLQEIRSCIDNLPDREFEDLYQDYIKDSQDKIIRTDTRYVERNFRSIEDISSVIKGLNILTEELKTW